MRKIKNGIIGRTNGDGESVETALANFPKDIITAPREWTERLVTANGQIINTTDITAKPNLLQALKRTHMAEK